MYKINISIWYLSSPSSPPDLRSGSGTGLPRPLRIPGRRWGKRPLTHLPRRWLVVTRTPTRRQNGWRDADPRYTVHGHRERESQWSPARWSPSSAVGRCSSPPPNPVPTRVRCTRTETSFGGTAPALRAVNTAAPDNLRRPQPSSSTTPLIWER